MATIRGRPSVSVPVLSKRIVPASASRSIASAVAGEDPPPGPRADRHGHRQGRGQAKGTRAGDHEHAHRREQAERKPGLRAERRPAKNVASAITEHRGHEHRGDPVGQLLDRRGASWASRTSRVIRATSESAAEPRASITIAPAPLIAPPSTRSPTTRSTASGSPVRSDSSQAVAPSRIVPSTGMRPPGLTRSTSPFRTAASGTCSPPGKPLRGGRRDPSAPDRGRSSPGGPGFRGVGRRGRAPRSSRLIRKTPRCCHRAGETPPERTRRKRRCDARRIGHGHAEADEREHRRPAATKAGQATHENLSAAQSTIGVASANCSQLPAVADEPDPRAPGGEGVARPFHAGSRCAAIGVIARVKRIAARAPQTASRRPSPDGRDSAARSRAARPPPEPRLVARLDHRGAAACGNVTRRRRRASPMLIECRRRGPESMAWAAMAAAVAGSAARSAAQSTARIEHDDVATRAAFSGHDRADRGRRWHAGRRQPTRQDRWPAAWPARTLRASTLKPAGASRPTRRSHRSARRGSLRRRPGSSAAAIVPETTSTRRAPKAEAAAAIASRTAGRPTPMTCTVRGGRIAQRADEIEHRRPTQRPPQRADAGQRRMVSRRQAEAEADRRSDSVRMPQATRRSSRPGPRARRRSRAAGDGADCHASPPAARPPPSRWPRPSSIERARAIAAGAAGIGQHRKVMRDGQHVAPSGPGHTGDFCCRLPLLGKGHEPVSEGVEIEGARARRPRAGPCRRPRFPRLRRSPAVQAASRAVVSGSCVTERAGGRSRPAGERAFRIPFQPTPENQLPCPAR